MKIKFSLFNIFILFFKILICIIFIRENVYAINIQSIKSEKGIKLWILEDKTTNIINLQFSFKSGYIQDPIGKEGLINLMCDILNEGGGALPAEIFLEKLDTIGAYINFYVTEDSIYGNLQCLNKNFNKAIDLLSIIINNPIFDKNSLNRYRKKNIFEIKSFEKNPINIGEKKFATVLYGNHPYGNQKNGTIDSLNNINYKDLIDIHKNLFSRENLKISIVGDIYSINIVNSIDKIFGRLSEKSKLRNIKDAKMNYGKLINIDYNLPQTYITLVYPGLQHEDKNSCPIMLMNNIIGGMNLTSRLFKEIRENLGLAYSIHSWLKISDYSSSFVISTGTKSSSAKYSLYAIQNEINKIVKEGFTKEELNLAKNYAIGSYHVKNFGSSYNIAYNLLKEQQQNQPINYLDIRKKIINNVTLKDINDINRKILTTKPSILIIGKKI